MVWKMDPDFTNFNFKSAFRPVVWFAKTALYGLHFNLNQILVSEKLMQSFNLYRTCRKLPELLFQVRNVLVESCVELTIYSKRFN